MDIFFTMKQFDVIVVGGGAAGMMAAYSAKIHHPDFTVAILDRTHELGRKLCIAGAGRGNLTNCNLKNYPSQYFFGNTSFIDNIFSQCPYEKIIEFFTELGIPLYEETKSEKGKIFSVIENAKTVRDSIVEKLKETGVEIYCDTWVQSLSKDNETWVIETDNTVFRARDCILATGGKTYPALGSDGSGFEVAKNLGHTIISPVPIAVPLVSKNLLSHLLQGEKIVMGVKAIVNGKETAHTIGDVLFTQYGLSGSAVLEVSRDISIRMNREKKQDCEIVLSFFPGKTREEIIAILNGRWEKHSAYLVARSLWGLLTVKFAGAVCAVAKIPKDRTVSDMSEDEKVRIINILSGYRTPIENTRGWNEAEFTAGGIDTHNINENTLESKIVPRLYFAGEIIDVDGMIGGYNLSWAWVSGYAAGMLTVSR